MHTALPTPIALLRAAALVVGGVALLGLTDNLVRPIAAEIGLWQLHAMRSAMALPLLVAAAWVLGVAHRPKRWGRVAARSLAQAGAMLIYFGALGLMPIAQVAAGLFTAPLFVLLFAAVLFGRPIGPWRTAAVAVGFIGTLIMLRPDPANLNPLVFIPVAAGALYGLSNLLAREWCADEPVAAMLGGFFLLIGIGGAIGAGVLAVLPGGDGGFLTRPWTPAPSAVVWGALLFQAAGSLVAVACIVRGYQSGEPSMLAPFEYFFLISASFFAWLLWGEALRAGDLVGMALILGSGVLVALAPDPEADQAARSAGANLP